MATKSYPIGTKIKFIGSCGKCKNKIGRITARDENGCYIDLPESLCSRAIAGSFYTVWRFIEPLAVKNQQLLFSFMER